MTPLYPCVQTSFMDVNSRFFSVVSFYFSRHFLHVFGVLVEDPTSSSQVLPLSPGVEVDGRLSPLTFLPYPKLSRLDPLPDLSPLVTDLLVHSCSTKSKFLKKSLFPSLPPNLLLFFCRLVLISSKYVYPSNYPPHFVTYPLKFYFYFCLFVFRTPHGIVTLFFVRV